jgi:uncharacterized protein with FMN-binding domain
MRRAVLTLTGTVAGLAALFSFRTHAPGIADVSAASTPSGLSATSPTATKSASPMLKTPASKPSASKSAKASMTTASASAASPTPTPVKMTAAPTPTASASTAPAGKSGTFAGPTESTAYGPVQVTITVSGGKITAANGSLESGGDSISENALPQLNSETVTAQKADIQAVSGATATSDGYIGSLQQAVDSAGL